MSPPVPELRVIAHRLALANGLNRMPGRTTDPRGLLFEHMRHRNSTMNATLNAGMNDVCKRTAPDESRNKVRELTADEINAISGGVIKVMGNLKWADIELRRGVG